MRQGRRQRRLYPWVRLVAVGILCAAGRDGSAQSPSATTAVSPWATGGVSGTTSAGSNGTGPLPYWQAPALPAAVIQGGTIPAGWTPQAVPYQGIGPDGRAMTMYYSPTYVFTYTIGPPGISTLSPTRSTTATTSAAPVSTGPAGSRSTRINRSPWTAAAAGSTPAGRCGKAPGMRSPPRDAARLAFSRADRLHRRRDWRRRPTASRCDGIEDDRSAGCWWRSGWRNRTTADAPVSSCSPLAHGASSQRPPTAWPSSSSTNRPANSPTTTADSR